MDRQPPPADNPISLSDPLPEDPQHAAHTAAKLLSRRGHPAPGCRLGLDVPTGFDHRRTRQREVAESMLLRADHLPLGEAALIKSLYGDKRTIREIAKMQGRCERGLRRELRRLSLRMLRPEFGIVIVQGPTWHPTRQRVGEAVYLHGLSMRVAATALGLSVYSVRMHSAAIRAIADAQRRAAAKARAVARGGAA